uniref:hypothetical protein n=1 Tax=Trichocoleus desertorum TaxID=1481672 RepID=UPI0025B40960|nr:hypothetical protein [Trichocoleus desertorum]
MCHKLLRSDLRYLTPLSYFKAEHVLVVILKYFNFIMRKSLLLLGLILFSTSPAIAGIPSWSSRGGQTSFDDAFGGGCNSDPDKRVIRYRTQDAGVKYTGWFWVKKSTGCRGQTELSGYFEDRNVSSNGTLQEWCKGSLTLTLSGNDVGAVGKATWSNITRADSNIPCKAAGKSYTVTLNFSL